MGFYSLSEESGVYRLLSHVYTIYPCADSIEWFIEDQAFLLDFDSLPTRIPPSPVSKLSLFQSLPVCHQSSLLTGEGGGGGREAKSFDREKAWPSLYKSFNTLCLCVNQAPLSRFSPSKQTSFCVPRLKKLIMVFIARNFLYKCGFLSS